MIIQIAILAFIAFAVSRVAIRYRQQDITGREFGLWLLLWLLVAAATLRPQLTDRLAQAVGVGRGADLLVYISIIALFFAAFKILVKLERTERDVTRIVRELALRDAQKKPDEKS